MFANLKRVNRISRNGADAMADVVELIPVDDQQDQAVFLAWESGKGPQALSREFGLTVTQVEQILDRMLPVARRDRAPLDAHCRRHAELSRHQDDERQAWHAMQVPSRPPAAWPMIESRGLQNSGVKDRAPGGEHCITSTLIARAFFAESLSRVSCAANLTNRNLTMCFA